jgi:V/A-type H+-transporting ATPase subunit B
MIDLFNTLVESQKLPIFSVSGEPYNPLLARIAMQAEVDMIILGGMGLKYDDYLFFKDTLEEGGALSRTIFFIHTASDPIVECLLCRTSRSPWRSVSRSRGNGFSSSDGYDELLRRLKEISITMEQVPSNRGYPEISTASSPPL